MIYKLEKDKILIWDFAQNKEIEVIFTEQVPIDKISINSSNDKIAVLQREGKVKNRKAYIIDLTTSQKIFEFKDFYDFQWHGSDSIILNDGNTIHLLTLKDGKSKKLVKFTRVRIGPNQISSSPDLTKFVFSKYEGDHQKLHLYDFNTASMTRFKPSQYHYTWLDNDRLVYDLAHGLKILHLSDDKSTNLLKSTNDLIRKAKIQNEQIKDMKSIIRPDDRWWNNIAYPVFVNERLYFKFDAINEEVTEKRIGIASAKIDLSDIQFHFYTSKGIIYNYYIMNNPEIIGVYMEPNNLLGENFEAEIQYYQNGKKLDFKGYMPILKPYMPTW